MSRKTKQPLSAPIPRLRFVFLIAILIFWATAIVARLVWLQLFRHAELAEREMRQQQRTFQVAPRRGVLYDRDLQPLAMTVLVDSVYAVPSEITDKSGTAKQLARIVHQDASDRYTSARDIDARLERSRNFAWVARKVDADVSARVRKLKLKGIYFQKEFKRFYPENKLAAHVLGYVSMDDNGLGGVERTFDSELHGTPGRVFTAVDARRQRFGSVEREPTQGENLVLTLDNHIQFIAERALDAAMQRTHSARGSVVVQDPNTGQILALAVRPSFNPNDIHNIRSSMLRDPAVSDIYEPGSVFKLVTYSAAINDHLTNPDEVIDGQGGRINVTGRLIHDWKAFGRITVREALQHSSDVCAIKIGLRLGPDRFYHYMREYGFGQRTGIQLPAETRGLLRPPDRWTPSSIGSLAMGQEIGVTPIQTVTMISTIANGGEYLPPSIVLKETPHSRGTPQLSPAAFHPEDGIPAVLPKGAHRVISTTAAAQMRSMMQTVVQAGTGKFVQLNGYSAGGKSGTAQKVDPGTHSYSKTNYVASFGGFAPVNRPAISVLVVLDSPRGGHHGGEVAGPVFGEVVQKTLEYLSVPHDLPIKPAKLIAAQHKNSRDEEEGDPQQVGDLTAMFAEINHLPADDPLRTPPKAVQASADADEAKAYRQTTSEGNAEQAVVEQSSEGNDRADSMLASRVQANTTSHSKIKNGDAEAAPASRVAVASGVEVTVPVFVGQPMRNVVASAANLGLNLHVNGSGIAVAQAPAAGSRVPAGTTVVVRFHP